MSYGKTYIGNSADSLKVAPDFDPISKIIVKVDDKTSYTSGNDSGRTITVENPFASQEIADAMLSRIQGTVHRPFDIQRAYIDPAVELGDGAIVGWTYGEISKLETTYGRLITANVSAPSEKQIDHEIPSMSKTQRKTQRTLSGLGGAISKLAKEFDTVSDEFGVRIGEAESSLEVIATHEKEYDEAIANLSARTDNAEASLKLTATQSSVNDLAQAQATLKTRIGDAEAAITLTATQSDVDNLRNSVQSLVNIKADLINLNSVATVNEGKLYAKSGLSVVGNTNLVGNVTLSGGSTLNVLAGSSISTPKLTTLHLYIDTTEYKPKSITSTSGSVTVLGA